jgi:hypothetical protein
METKGQCEKSTAERAGRSLAGSYETEESSCLVVHVLFTDFQATAAALETAASLASSLAARIQLLAFQAVPYAVPLDMPPVSAEFIEKRLFDLISRLDRGAREAGAHLYLCRNRREALLQVLAPHSLVVIGARRLWWPLSRNKIAAALRSAGHHVLLADPGAKGRKPELRQAPSIIRHAVRSRQPGSISTVFEAKAR